MPKGWIKDIIAAEAQCGICGTKVRKDLNSLNLQRHIQHEGWELDKKRGWMCHDCLKGANHQNT